MTPDFDFSRIRAEGGDRREGFEEFSAQIFHRHTVTAGGEEKEYYASDDDEDSSSSNE